MGFNPATDPSVRAYTSSGDVEALCLVDLMRRGTDLAGLYMPDPITEACLLRLLTAIVGAAIKDQDPDTAVSDPRAALVQFHNLPVGEQTEIAASYISKWAAAFEMDRAVTDQPLYQNTDVVPKDWDKLPELDKLEPIHVNALRPERVERPSREDLLGIVCRMALADLGGLTKSPIINGKAGSRSRQSSPLSGSASVFIQGATLWQTLLSNVCPWVIGEPGDKPQWEFGSPEYSGIYAPSGPLGYLTSTTRAIFIEFDQDSGEVVGAIPLPGQTLPASASEVSPVYDPFVIRRTSSTDGMVRAINPAVHMDRLDAVSLMAVRPEESIVSSARVVIEQSRLLRQVGHAPILTTRVLYSNSGDSTNRAKRQALGEIHLPVNSDVVTDMPARIRAARGAEAAMLTAYARRYAERLVIGLSTGVIPQTADVPSILMGQFRDTVAQLYIDWTSTRETDLSALQERLTSAAVSDLELRLESLSPDVLGGREKARYDETENYFNGLTPGAIKAGLHHRLREIFGTDDKDNE